MPRQRPDSRSVFSEPAFLLLVAGVSALFAWIIWPFFTPILWATILAILFRPLYARLTDWLRQRRSAGALATLFLILAIVILPMTVITVMLIQETRNVLQAMQSGELDVVGWLHRVGEALPAWLAGTLERFNLTDAERIRAQVSERLTNSAGVVASQALNVGQNALEFVVNLFIMLYLLFFFLRNGDALVARIARAVPLQQSLQRRLMGQFTNTIRAIVKGTLVVAIVQGTLGGIAFWILGISAPVLWGVVMAFLSLLPAIGTAIVWAPVAIYFLVTGAIWKGVGLIAYGVLVIGLVDNLLRPILVGNDTKIPDYVILITTLGGLGVMGLNGLVLGPVIAALFLSIWTIVAESRAAVDTR
jgi:predicted PurR-regulated permease PerM